MAKCKKITVFSDGASRGNPGPAAIAYSIYDDAGICIESGSRAIGPATNNEAEYQAFLLAIERACVHCKDTVRFFLDSELVVRQVKGEYCARDDRMKTYLGEVRVKMRCFKDAQVWHVSRQNERTQLVDRMVNEELDRSR